MAEQVLHYLMTYFNCIGYSV